MEVIASVNMAVMPCWKRVVCAEIEDVTSVTSRRGQAYGAMFAWRTVVTAGCMYLCHVFAETFVALPFHAFSWATNGS